MLVKFIKYVYYFEILKNEEMEVIEVILYIIVFFRYKDEVGMAFMVNGKIIYV